MGLRSFLENEAAVAIGTFDVMLVAHLQKDARMAERAAAVANDAGIFDFNGFRDFDGHGAILAERGGRIIAMGNGSATVPLYYSLLSGCRRRWGWQRHGSRGVVS
jgi:hypothetical protein